MSWKPLIWVMLVNYFLLLQSSCGSFSVIFLLMTQERTERTERWRWRSKKKNSQLDWRGDKNRTSWSDWRDRDRDRTTENEESEEEEGTEQSVEDGVWLSFSLLFPVVSVASNLLSLYRQEDLLSRDRELFYSSDSGYRGLLRRRNTVNNSFMFSQPLVQFYQPGSVSSFSSLSFLSSLLHSVPLFFFFQCAWHLRHWWLCLSRGDWLC